MSTSTARGQQSKFTKSDLQLLSQFSPASPLRVIALVDCDAFYAQCEGLRLGLPPSQPLAVRQWNAIIALNYAARDRGLKRGMSIEDVQRQCPGIKLPHIPTWRAGDDRWRYRADILDHLTTDKAALDPYREMSRRIMNLVKGSFSAQRVRLERASVDEFYIDLSAQVHDALVERFLGPDASTGGSEDRLPLPSPTKLRDGSAGETDGGSLGSSPDGQADWDDVALDIGADIISDLRQKIREHLGITTSAGISHNKMLAKMASRIHKPNQQTTMYHSSIPQLLEKAKISDVPRLGGKLGQLLTSHFATTAITDILPLSLAVLTEKLGPEHAQWVHDAVRGHETGPVVPRTRVQSLLSAKTFVPPLEDMDQATPWLRIFAVDLLARLRDLNDDSPAPRRPRTIAVHHHVNGRFGPTRSGQEAIRPGVPLDGDFLLEASSRLLQKLTEEEASWPCVGISVSLSNLEMGVPEEGRITSFFPSGDPGPVQKRRRDEGGGSDGRRKRFFVDGALGDSSRPGTRAGESSREFSTEMDSGRNSPALQATAEYDCPICGRSIEAAAVLEHLDWHVAMDVQSQVDAAQPAGSPETRSGDPSR